MMKDSKVLKTLDLMLAQSLIEGDLVKADDVRKLITALRNDDYENTRISVYVGDE